MARTRVSVRSMIRRRSITAGPRTASDAGTATLDEPLLRERRPLVGRMRLLTEAASATRETFLTQRLRNLHAGLAATDDHDSGA